MSAFIITKEGITVLIDGVPNTIQKEDKNYDEVYQCIKDKDWERVSKLINKEKAVANFAKGKIEVKDGLVFFGGEQVHGYVVEKILQFIEEDVDAEPLLNFLTKVMENPSKRCVDQLFGFLEHKNMPIDPDGDFYAYKAVRSDWLDKHSGTIDNSIGKIIEVARNKVDDQPENACSHGLHAGSMQYVSGFKRSGDHVIIVKINPKDVVAVPEYDTSKLRCCRYEVVTEFEGLLPDTTYDFDETTEEDECDSGCSYCGESMEFCDCDAWDE